MREKKEKEDRMAKQRALYEEDQRRRFGDNWKSKTPAREGDKPREELKGFAQAEHAINVIRQFYTEENHPGVAQTCFKTCEKLISNHFNEPTNDKFQKVNLQNNAIKQRIVQVRLGISILKGAGFVETDDDSGMTIGADSDKAEIQKILDFLRANIK